VVEASMLTGVPWRRLLLDSPKAAAADRLGNRQLAKRLPRATPTLIMHGGPTDVVVPNWDFGPMTADRGSPPKVVPYGRSGHLPFIDEREIFLFDLLDFLDDVEGVKTPRVGLVNINTRFS
jgi:pimeloyl-ACP methyl ester carboxylesterase